MEKFTVDLDKVLDEFEFNEEQAFHQENFRNEDLPAKRYQKPHFQPINMADADFSPSLETTLSFSSHNRKLSQDSTNSSVISDNITFASKYNDVNQMVISELAEAPHVNNRQIPGNEAVTAGDGETNSEFGKEDEEEEEDDDDDEEEEEEEDEDEEESDVDDEDSDAEDVEEDEKAKEVPEERKEDTQEGKFEGSSIRVDIIPEVINQEAMSKIEDSKPDLIGREEGGKEDHPKLPDLTDVNKESCQESEASKIENFDLISNEREQEPTEKSEDESEAPSQATDVEDATVKPIRFQSQDDITDEDLYRYLEELEEEEERNAEKPTRPDFLDLNERNEPERSSSPGATPLPETADEDLNPEALGTKEEVSEPKQEASEAVVLSQQQPQQQQQEQQEEESEASAAVQDSEGSSAVGQSADPAPTIDERRLGKVSPFWIPDRLAANCMHCDSKFTVLRRRHHCRACGKILCWKCCAMKAPLEYLQNQEQRVCNSCFYILAKVVMYEMQNEGEHDASPSRRPNPNNPMEYCSTVPPPLQVSSSGSQSPPSVLVPVGVLKREGTSKVKESTKQVMFSDGIRPGGDLTDLDGSSEQRLAFRRPGRSGSKRVGTPPGSGLLSPVRMLPPIDPRTQSFVPEKGLPPVCVVNKGETTYHENWTQDKLVERLRDKSQPPLTFAVNLHLIVSLKIVELDCCMHKTCWVFCTKGMECVGQDEILILLTLKDESDAAIPREVFLQLHYIYQEAAKGNTITELGCWCVPESNFLDSPQHGGFLFIRPTFQCRSHIETPPPPYLVGVLIHRSEIPWARVFPIRLMLRLGAEFRYYPCPLVSVRFREPVYYELLGHTIIHVLADFKNLSYTLPNVRGLRIHVESKQTSILIPRNRYDQVIRALNNSNEPVLALAGNFSQEADAHLVCIQSKGDEVTYETQTININDKPQNVTGASFVVLNGGLKSTSGLSAKWSYVEDGLLVQVPNETMTVLRNKLHNMEDWSVRCGPVDGDGAEEVVKIVWCEDDKNFNVGVKSVIDNMAMDGIPSMRTHNFADCYGSTKFIRWTQVFIIKCEDGATSAKVGDPLEVNKISENIARATCIALKKLLDLLAASGLLVLAVRATIDQENVGYEAGSNGEKLPPIYMNSLDNELIPVLHDAAAVNDSVAVLELVFHIMDQ